MLSSLERLARAHTRCCVVKSDMATNLQIDDELLLEAQKLGDFKTKKETVNQALRAFIEHHKQLEILELEGQIEYYDDYDYKKQRQRR